MSTLENFLMTIIAWSAVLTFGYRLYKGFSWLYKKCTQCFDNEYINIDSPKYREINSLFKLLYKSSVELPAKVNKAISGIAYGLLTFSFILIIIELTIPKVKILNNILQRIKELNTIMTGTVKYTSLMIVLLLILVFPIMNMLIVIFIDKHQGE